jgi:hypothetical protein
MTTVANQGTLALGRTNFSVRRLGGLETEARRDLRLVTPTPGAVLDTAEIMVRSATSPSSEVRRAVEQVYPEGQAVLDATHSERRSPQQFTGR